jgi:adenosylcobinamide-phosphate synthase
LFTGPAGVLVLALALEIAIGDPVSRWHPVALFGRALSLAIRFASAHSPRGELVYGALLVALAVSSIFIGTALALHLLGTVVAPLAVVAGAALLKTSFSFRQLEAEAARAADLIEREGVLAAHGPLTALVSRDVNGLSPGLAASAAIESVAENLSDSFVAPLFYYVVLGVPGALAYRAINTLDAMIGYHGRYEHFGRVAARLDDVANLIPARLTAALLVVASGLAGADPRSALAIGFRDHRRTESPNAGWPMAVMAGALHVQLEKTGHYRLGETADNPTPSSIRRALPVARWAAGVAVALALCVLAASALAN